MTILRIIELLLSLASALMGHVERQGYVKQGETNAERDQLKHMVERLRKARLARATPDAVSVSDDPNNRDRHSM